MVNNVVIQINKNGLAKQPGVDMGTKTPILLGIDMRRRVVAFHLKGTLYWSGRGSQSYSSAGLEFGQFETVGLGTDGGITLSGYKSLLDAYPTRAIATKDIPHRIEEVYNTTAGKYEES